MVYKIVKLKFEHVIILAIAVFLLYYLTNRCSYNGFNVGGQRGPCALYDTYVWAGSTGSKIINNLGPFVSRTTGNNLVNNYMSEECKSKLEKNCSNIEDPIKINECVRNTDNNIWGVVNQVNQNIKYCGPPGTHCVPQFIGNTCIGYDTITPGCSGSNCKRNPNVLKQFRCEKNNPKTAPSWNLVN